MDQSNSMYKDAMNRYEEMMKLKEQNSLDQQKASNEILKNSMEMYSNQMSRYQEILQEKDEKL